jgi:hypothetical protein
LEAPPAAPAAPIKKQRQSLPAVLKQQLCQLAQDHPDWTQDRLALEFGASNPSLKLLHRGNVSKIIGEASKWLNVSGKHKKQKKARSGKFEELDDALFKWFTQVGKIGRRILFFFGLGKDIFPQTGIDCACCAFAFLPKRINGTVLCLRCSSPNQFNGG